ncbi:hypothetical protein ACIQCM_08775 [Pseudarthrobacter sp. NPDC092439]
MTAYTPPSACQLCIPTEHHTNDSALLWTVELAHQEICPNHPAKTEVTR